MAPVTESTIPVHCDSGEKLQLKTLPAVSTSLAGGRRRRAPCACDAFPGEPPNSRRQDLRLRQCLRAVERRLALDVLGATDRDIKAAAIRRQLPHGRRKPVARGERRRCCVAADHTQSTGKLAKPESGLAACPEVESASGQRRWCHAHVPARRHPSPAGPASLSEIRELRRIEAA
jgi:hypothetical protein